MTKQNVMAAMKKAGIEGKFAGAGRTFTVEVPNEDAMNALTDLVPALGGYRSGHGSWVLSLNYGVSDLDSNNPAHPMHY